MSDRNLCGLALQGFHFFKSDLYYFLLMARYSFAPYQSDSVEKVYLVFYGKIGLGNIFFGIFCMPLLIQIILMITTHIP